MNLWNFKIKSNDNEKTWNINVEIKSPISKKEKV